MRDRRSVADRRNANSGLADRTNSRLAAAARTFYANLDLSHAGFDSLPRSLGSGLLGRKRRALARTAKASCPRRGLCNEIPQRVGNRYQRVVERCRDMDDPERNVLSLFLFISLFLWCCFCHKKSFVSNQRPVTANTAHCFPSTANYFLPGAFFLATAALRGPFLVRAFVCVRCPRTGRLRR